MSLWITARFGGAVEREMPSNATPSTDLFRHLQATTLEDLT